MNPLSACLFFCAIACSVAASATAAERPPRANHAPPAVVVAARIREGETITKDRLKVTPYLPTLSDASTFSTIAPIAGRVALKDMEERSVVPRSSVGAKPEIQFKITPATELRIRASYRRGVVVINAKQEYRQCELDTSTLPAAQAAELRNEVARSKVLLASADAFEIMAGGYEDYTLAITVNGVTKTLVWSSESAPPEARRLVGKYLKECAPPVSP